MAEDIAVLEISEVSQRRRVQSHLSRLRKLVSGGRHAQAEEFNSILGFARILAKQDPKALLLLVRLIGRSVQGRMMTHVLRQPESSGFSCDSDSVLFSSAAELTRNGRRLDQLKREVPSKRVLELGVDLLLPWPWNSGRLLNCLSKLGPSGEWGAWRQDQNHCIELWLPLGIGWVHGGNHSLSVGIVRAKGKIKPEVTYDISAVYRHVTCDGLAYRRKHDDSVIGPVPDLEMAAIFEIGRLIHTSRISF